jgi:hypothetical protein
MENSPADHLDYAVRSYAEILYPMLRTLAHGEESTKLRYPKLREFFTKDRNLLVQNRVNEHLLFCSGPPQREQRLVMNPQNSLQNERSLPSEFKGQYSVGGTASAAAEAPSTPVSADRLYQLAALTAGVFLLATLL